MTWVKKDDDWPDQAQWAFAEWLEPQDESLYDRLLAWCNRYVTDGHVPLHRVAAIAHPRQTDVQASLDRLMQVNPVTEEALVERSTVGVVLTGYHRNQPRRQKVIDDREHIHDVRSEAGKKGAAARWTNGKPDSKRDGNLPSARMAKRGGKSDGPVPGPVPRTPEMHISRPSGASRTRGGTRELPQSGLDERSQEVLPLGDLLEGFVSRIPGAREAVQ